MKRKIPLQALAPAILFAMSAPPSAAEDQAIDIGSRREIFVDRLLIDRLDGARMELKQPHASEDVFRFEKPWEGLVSGYITVLKDGDQFRLYYRGRPTTSRADGSVDAHEVACVALSDDGIHWTRPNLGIYPGYGDSENNVILAPPDPTAVTHNFCPFIDDRPGVAPEERYKAVGGTGKSGLIAYASADGLHWKRMREEPILTEGAFDSQNNVFWSEHEQTYVCYFRTWTNNARWIARSASKEFLTDWPKGENMGFSGAPPEHLYVNQTRPYFRAPHIYLGTAARFMPGRKGLTPEQIEKIGLLSESNYGHLDEACSDAVLLSSRGGMSYQRNFLEAMVRPGLDKRNWGARSNYPACGIVQTGPTEMSVYVQRHYGWPSVHVERLAYRLDGLSSVNAPYEGGEMLTKPIVFSGKELLINFSTSAPGCVRVEMQQPDGTPIPGFALDDCPEIIGDDIERVISWTGDPSLESLAGKPVRLRFVMKDADLYAIRFK